MGSNKITTKWKIVCNEVLPGDCRWGWKSSREQYDGLPEPVPELCGGCITDHHQPCFLPTSCITRPPSLASKSWIIISALGFLLTTGVYHPGIVIAINIVYVNWSLVDMRMSTVTPVFFWWFQIYSQIGQYLMTLPQHLEPLLVNHSPALNRALQESNTASSSRLVLTSVLDRSWFSFLYMTLTKCW